MLYLQEKNSLIIDISIYYIFISSLLYLIGLLASENLDGNFTVYSFSPALSLYQYISSYPNKGYTACQPSVE